MIFLMSIIVKLSLKDHMDQGFLTFSSMWPN